MSRYGKIFVIGLVLGIPMLGFAQGTNSGATVTAPFFAKPPVIDGKVSAGEWDAAGIAPGTWSAHDSTTVAAWKTTVKVCYSLDAVYFLYECEDPQVQSSVTGTEYYHGLADVAGQMNSAFGWGGETDYVALYIDPANYADNAPGADDFSYSIQWEPSITAKNEKDSAGNSYFYTESGRWGGFRALFNPPVIDKNGKAIYWGGGVAWQPKVQIVDGPMTGGFVCEVRIPWAGLNGYWRRSMENGVDLGGGLFEITVNGDAMDAYYSEWGALKVLNVASDGTGVPVGTGIVTGMPAEGTVWKVQFCRYSNGDLGYVNWVGDTGGFVSRPFGNLVFGPASGTQVEDAMLH